MSDKSAMHIEPQIFIGSLSRRCTGMVLNQIRARIKPAMDSIGRSLGKAGVNPNELTYVSFALAILSGVLFALKSSQPYLAAISITCSGVFDMLDGAVARATNKVSTTGSFNDSTLDRVSEIAIYAGIIYGGYHISPVAVLLALSFSLLVSYVRAKGESLAITMSGVGIGERAERFIVLIIFALVGFVWLGVYVVLVLAAVTFVQRYSFIARTTEERTRLK